jgi:hypothetical protein
MEHDVNRLKLGRKTEATALVVFSPWQQATIGRKQTGDHSVCNWRANNEKSLNRWIALQR